MGVSKKSWFSNLLPEITGAINAVGHTIGKIPLTNGLPGLSNVAELAQNNPIIPIAPKSAVGEFLNPQGDVSNIPADYKNYNPQVMPALGTDMAMGKLPVIEGTGTRLIRDKRMNIENPKAFKTNTNPKEPIVSQKFTPPESGLTPEDLKTQQPSPDAQIKPTPKQPKPVNYTTTDVGKPGKVHISTDSNIESAPQLDNAQKAVDNIPGTTATEKFNNWHSRMSEISNNITDYNTAHPVDVPEAEIKANIVAKVKPFIAPEGMSPTEAQVNGFITQEQANIIADDTVRQLKLKAGIETPTIGAQSDIPIDQVTEMKQSFNDIYGPLLAKRASGAPLTAAQQIQLAARDGLDTAIGFNQPNIKAMTLEQSGLYDAQPQLAKQFNVEYSSAHQPGPIQKFMGQSTTNKLLEGAGIIAGGSYLGDKVLPPIVSGAMLAGQKISKYLPEIGSQVGIGPFNLGGVGVKPSSNSQKNNETQNNVHTTIIAPDVNHLPQKADEVQVSDDGGAGITNPYTSGLAISTADYKSQKAKLESQKADYQKQAGADIYHPKQLAADQANIAATQTQLDNLEAQNTASRGLDDPYNNANKIVSGVQNTLSDLKKSGTSLLESNGTINDAKYRTDKNYSALVSTIDYMQKQTGMTIYTPGITADALKNNILQAEKRLLYDNYYAKLGGSFTGGATDITNTNQLPPITSKPTTTPVQTGQEASYQFTAPNPGWGQLPPIQ